MIPSYIINTVSSIQRAGFIDGTEISSMTEEHCLFRRQLNEIADFELLTMVTVVVFYQG